MALIGFFVQEAFDLEWGWLGELQQLELYKRWSGAFLAAYVMSQWRLSILRVRKSKAASRNLQTHRWLGALAPLCFYVHSIHLGYSYLFLFSMIYFANTALGLLNRDVLGISNKLFFNAWMIAHVTLSTLMVLLMLYHVYIAFSFE